MLGFPRIVGLVCLVGALTVGRASADLGTTLSEMGDLERWSIFAFGSKPQHDDLSGYTSIEGDVGVAGAGNFSVRDNSTIEGNLYYRSNVTLTLDPSAQITGAEIHNQDSVLDNDVKLATITSRHAANLTANFGTKNIQLNSNTNFTITGAPGATVVLKLGTFTLKDASTLTLQGTAGTTFIINVRKQFALSGNAKIVLSGGLEWNDVLFNVTGKKGTVSLSGNPSLSGILMATRRTVQLFGTASITGEVIANRVSLSKSISGGNVTIGHPPIVSP